MAKLTSEAILIGQDDFVSSATAMAKLGARAVDGTGRVFHYAKAGGVDLVAGNVVQGPAIVTAHLANTPPAVAIGLATFTYTPGAATGTLNQYADGYMQVDTTPGNGYTYSVSGHPAIGSGTAFTLTLNDAIQIALTTASRVGLLANRYAGVIQFPVTTATGLLAGVATYIIATTQFGWIQTWGICSVLINGTPALGAAVVSPSATTAGSVDVITTTNLVTAQLVGYMAQIGVSTKNNFVDLKIFP